MTKRSQVVRMLIAGVTFWAIAFAAYKMGQGDNKQQTKKEDLQRVVDSLEASKASAEKKWQEIKENNARTNRKLDEAITVITNFKPIVKYEIIKTEQKLRAIPDSAMQHYVDSIRAAGGFH